MFGMGQIAVGGFAVSTTAVASNPRGTSPGRSRDRPAVRAAALEGPARVMKPLTLTHMVGSASASSKGGYRMALNRRQAYAGRVEYPHTEPGSRSRSGKDAPAPTVAGVPRHGGLAPSPRRCETLNIPELRLATGTAGTADTPTLHENEASLNQAARRTSPVSSGKREERHHGRAGSAAAGNVIGLSGDT